MAGEATREYVLGRCAYSELNSPEQGGYYGDVGQLRAKEADHVPFADLTEQARALLFSKWQTHRGFAGGIIAAALAGVEKFQVKHWTKARLGSGYILPHFHQWLGAEHAVGETTFKDWIEAEPSGELPSTHPLRII